MMDEPESVKSLLRELITEQKKTQAAFQATQPSYTKQSNVTVLSTASTTIVQPDDDIVGVTITNLDSANAIYINVGGQPTNSTLNGHYLAAQQSIFISAALGDDPKHGVTGIAANANVNTRVTTAYRAKA